MCFSACPVLMCPTPLPYTTQRSRGWCVAPPPLPLALALSIPPLPPSSLPSVLLCSAVELIPTVLSPGLTVPFALTAGLSSLGSSRLVYTAGIAELVSGALSMGVGGFLSAQAERDHYRYLRKNTRVRSQLSHAACVPPQADPSSLFHPSAGARSPLVRRRDGARGQRDPVPPRRRRRPISPRRRRAPLRRGDPPPAASPAVDPPAVPQRCRPPPALLLLPQLVVGPGTQAPAAHGGAQVGRRRRRGRQGLDGLPAQVWRGPRGDDRRAAVRLGVHDRRLVPARWSRPAAGAFPPPSRPRVEATQRLLSLSRSLSRPQPYFFIDLAFDALMWSIGITSVVLLVFGIFKTYFTGAAIGVSGASFARSPLSSSPDPVTDPVIDAPSLRLHVRRRLDPLGRRFCRRRVLPHRLGARGRGRQVITRRPPPSFVSLLSPLVPSLAYPGSALPFPPTT